MTTPEGVIPDDPSANDEPAPLQHRKIVRIRTTAMDALPQRTPFADFASASPGDDDA